MADEPIRYKFTLAPPSDTDPPTDPIWTRDRIIGVNPPMLNLQDMPTPQRYGATGDGSTDDTTAMQTWLDAIKNKTGYLPTGTYAVSASLVVRDGTSIFGAGRHVAIISKMPGFPQAQPLISVPVNDFHCYHVCFQGSSSDPVSAALVDAPNASRLMLQDCTMQHHRYIMFAISNGFDIRVEDCEVYDWGSITTPTNPGACEYEGGSGLLFISCDRVQVVNNYLHNGQWTAIVFYGQNALIQNNIILTVNEAGIYGPGINFSIIRGNRITSVRRKDCSAHGMELDGQNLLVCSNVVYDTDLASIYMTNPVVVQITDNICNTPNQERAQTLVEGSTGAITIRGTTPSSVNRLLVARNICSDATGKSSYGIVFYDAGCGPMLNLLCSGNNLSPLTQWQGTAIPYNDPYFGTFTGPTFMVRDNLGAEPSDISVSSINFIIPQGTTGAFRVGAVGFTSSWIQFLAARPTGDTLAACSSGLNSWQTGWDIETQTITTARSYFSSSCINWAANEDGGFSSDASGRGAVNVRDTEGKPICVAAVTSLDTDGFTMEILDSISVEVNSGGATYAVGDTGTIGGGDGLATYTVTGESGGAVTSVTVSGGSGYVSATGAATTATTGAGTGLTLDIFSGSPTVAEVVVTATCHA